MSAFFIRTGQTLPKIRATLPMVIPETATVTFRMRAAEGGALKINAAATVLDANAGIVQYTFSETDTDTVGFYYVDWLFEDVSGTRAIEVETYRIVVILPDL